MLTADINPSFETKKEKEINTPRAYKSQTSVKLYILEFTQFFDIYVIYHALRLCDRK